MCECKNPEKTLWEKDYIWNPATCSYESGKYLGIIIDNSLITCDDIIDVDKTETVTTNFNEKESNL